jgi:beta-mannosidase
VTAQERRVTDLSGSWRVAPLSTRLHRVGADPDLDDLGWATIDVPGHWGSHDDFAGSDGPLLYRTRFDSPALGHDERAWLTLDGVMCQSDVWLDGGFTGTTGLYFSPTTFEVTEAVRARSDHSLAVEVACPAPDAGRSKRTFTGSIQQGPLTPPGCPGGIWRPVRLELSGPVAIRSGRLFCRRATFERAVVVARVVLDAAAPREVNVATQVRAPGGAVVAEADGRHDLAAGENQLEWEVEIDLPMLWWPRSMGDQPIYDVTVTVSTGDDHEPLIRSWRTGLRSVDVDDLRWRVNGESLFVKGITMGPQSNHLAELTPHELERDLMTTVDAGLDLVRIHSHITRPEVYSAADRLGLLIWQDLPLSGGYALSARRMAQRVARAATDLLAHHPSISVWCAHDEPNGPPLPLPEADEPTAGRGIGRHLLPSWNRSVLDPLLRRELRSSDPSRSVILRSGSLPGVSSRSTSDAHLWLGWHNGTHDELPDVLHNWPRLASFLGGFGAQTVRVADWSEDEPTWTTAQRRGFERYQPRRAYPDGETWARATQMYQADLIRSHIGTMRRLKYRPAGGFCLTSLFDAEPDGGFGILDHERRPKPSFESVVDACRPVVVIADLLPGTTSPGERLTVAIHAVSDVRHRIENVSVRARAEVGVWSTERRWVGDLPADSCEHIGDLEITVPDLTGVLTVDVELDAADRVVTHRSHTVVVPAAEA